MHIKEFIEKVNTHSGLHCKGIIKKPEPLNDEIVVEYTPSNALFKVNVETILRNKWEEMENVLTGKREPVILDHMTRIVGYFSKVKNWNKSKLGELRDRQAGDYTFSH